jgi:hypothetical protein
MTPLNYDEWKADKGIVENNDAILHLTEQSHGRDVREVIDEFLIQQYEKYVSQFTGE